MLKYVSTFSDFKNMIHYQYGVFVKYSMKEVNTNCLDNSTRQNIAVMLVYKCNAHKDLFYIRVYMLRDILSTL